MISRITPTVIGFAVAGLLAGCGAGTPVSDHPAAPSAPLVTPGSPAGPGSSIPMIPEPSGLVSLALADPRAAFTDAVCGMTVLPDTGNRLVISDPPTQAQRLRAALGSGEVLVSRDGPAWGLDLRSWTRGDVVAARANSPACR